MAGGSGESAAGSIGYRPEIDGLRAIAVVPVVLFHAGFPVFSGGFVGVDVFFVISGYLITGILLGDIDKDRFSIARFYQRRARRILPALFCVLLCCLPLAWFAMLPDELARFGKSIVAVIGFASNITFWLEEGYFSAASELKPLLHTWSLAVEEQFYIVFPLLLFLLRKIGRRNLTLMIAVAALGSFALCELAAYRFQLANFYLAPTRAWELLGGSFCACIGPQQFRRTAGWLALAGLALILAAIFLLDGTYAFPSHWALLPVAGSMMLILFARADRGVGRMLALPPFVGIGLVSYSLYLWHQPLFAFARLAVNGPVTREMMVGLALLAGALSVLSWRFVEQPFRRSTGPGEARRSLRLAMGLALALAAIGAGLWLSKGLPGRFTPSRDPQILAMTKADPPAPADEAQCPPGQDGTSLPCMIIANASPMNRIALFGDSHAMAMLPAFRALARQRHAELHYAATAGCPPLIGGYILNGNLQPDACAGMAAQELAYARAAHVDTVYLVGRWTLYASEDPMTPEGRYLLADTAHPLFWKRSDSARVMASLLGDTVARYRAAGIRVVVLDQIPAQQFLVDRTLKWAALRSSSDGLADAVRNSAVKVADYEALRSQTELALAAASANGAEILRLNDLFREGDRYPWAAPGASWYKDASHVSYPGAMRMVPAILASFDRGRVR